MDCTQARCDETRSRPYPEMIHLTLILLRGVSEAHVLTNTATRAVAQSARELRAWASQSTVPELVAAPVITEATYLVETVVRHAKDQVARPLSYCAMVDLCNAHRSLQELLSEELSWPKNHDECSLSGETAVFRDPMHTVSPARWCAHEHDMAARIAGFHTRVLVCVLFVIVAVGSATIVMAAFQNIHAYRSELGRARIDDLIGIAMISLDILYEKLQQSGLDIRISGVHIATALLEELSTSHSSTEAEKSFFYKPSSSLFEYRVGVQNFAQRGRVALMASPRNYPLLCSSNFSHEIHDFPHDHQPLTAPLLTPDNCGDDSRRHGVFSGLNYLLPTHGSYVETYRRNRARLGNFFHTGFRASVAITYDYQTLQELMAPTSTEVGFQRFLDNAEGDWQAFVARWLGVLLGGLLLMFLLLTELMTLPRLSQLHLGFAVLYAVCVGSALIAVKVIAQRAATTATRVEEEASCALMSRIISSLAMSNTLRDNNITSTVVSHIAEKVLQSRLLVYNTDTNEVHPTSMTPVAQQVRLQDLLHARIIQRSGYVSGYAFSYFYNTEDSQLFLYLEQENYHVSLGLLWVAAAFGIIAFVFVYLYLRLSPLSRVITSGQGSPLLQHYVQPQHLRMFLYIALVVIVVSSQVALSRLDISLLEAATTQLSRETMEMLGASIRTPSISNGCETAECGLPSYITELNFSHENNKVLWNRQFSPYPTPPGTDWTQWYYGAQLALSKVSIVLENMLSFSTPLVNRTSGYIEPRYLQHRMLAAVDVSGPSALVLERLPSSTQSPTYAFVSQSIGLCLVLGAVCIGVCVLEWLYTRMGRLQRERKSLRNSYVMMSVVVLLVSSMLAVNVAIMMIDVERVLEKFSIQELSMVTVAVAARMGSAVQSVYVNDVLYEVYLDGIRSIVDNLTLSVQRGIPFAARWRLLLEYPEFGSGRVMVLGGDSNDTSTFDLRMDVGMNAVCSTNMEFGSGNRKRSSRIACYAQLSTRRDMLERDPRMYLLVWRNRDEMIGLPLNHWWRVIVPLSLTACALLSLFCLLVLWWVLRPAAKAGFPVCESSVAKGSSQPWSQTGLMVDSVIPIRRRYAWLIITAVSLISVLIYFTLCTCSIAEMIAETKEPVYPIRLEDDRAQSMWTRTALTALHFIAYPDTDLVTSGMKQIVSEVLSGHARYQFVNDSESVAFAAGCHEILHSALAFGEFAESSQMAELGSTGKDSYQTAVGVAYLAYIQMQDEILKKVGALLDLVDIFLSQGDTTMMQTSNAPPALHDIEILTAMMHKLFILDHVSIASYYDGRSSVGFVERCTQDPDNPIDIAQLGENMRTAHSSLLESVDAQLRKLVVDASVLMTTSPLLNLVQNHIAEISKSYHAAIAMTNSSAPIWHLQYMRCVEQTYIGNLTAEYLFKRARVSTVQDVVRVADKLLEIMHRDTNIRKSFQLTEYTTSLADVSNMKAKLPAENAQRVDTMRTKLIVCFICAASLWVVMVGCSASWYAVLRCGIVDRPWDQKEDRKADSLEAPHYQVSYPSRRRDILPFLILGLLVLVPMSCGFWQAFQLSRVSQLDLINIESIVQRSIALQRAFSSSVDAMLVSSAKSVATGDLSEYKTASKQLEVLASEFFIAYGAVLSDVMEGDELLWSMLRKYRDLYAEASKRIMQEMQAHDAQVAMHEWPILSKVHSKYPQYVLTTMTADDEWSILLPMSSVGNHDIRTLSDQLFDAAVTSAGNEETYSTNKLDAYRKQIDALVRTSTAHLQMWNAAIGGINSPDVAVEYSNFVQLVGGNSLEPLATSGVSGASNAMVAIHDFYAPLLSAAPNADAVRKVFTTTTEPTSEVAPVSAYLNAGYVSSFLASIITAGTFSNIYAYNRGLTPHTIVLRNLEPLSAILRQMTLISEQLITTELRSREYHYVHRDATRNQWIWAKEIVGMHVSLTSSTNFKYLHISTEWCCVAAFALLFLVVATASATAGLCCFGV